MTSTNFAFALDQDLPALPKWLFVLLADAHGLSETYDIFTERYLHRTGMTVEELAASLFYLEDHGLLRVIRLLPEATPGWTVQFTYGGEYGPTGPVARNPTKQRSNNPGWLYVIGTSHGISKVGITTDLPSRANSIVANAAVDARLEWSHACPISAARAFERAILDHFQADKFKGEWVRRPAPDVIAAAKEIIERGPP